MSVSKNRSNTQQETTIPSETIIYFSKWKTSIYTIILTAILGVCLYTLQFSFVGSFILVLGIYFGFKQYKAFADAFRMTPQIRLNFSGLQTVNTSFIPWSEIKNIQVTKIGSLRSDQTPAYYLTFDYPNGNENLRIGSFDVTKEELIKLIHAYRTGRSRYF